MGKIAKEHWEMAIQILKGGSSNDNDDDDGGEEGRRLIDKFGKEIAKCGRSGDWCDCCDVAMLRCVWATVVTVVPCRLVGWARAPSKMV